MHFDEELTLKKQKNWMEDDVKMKHSHETERWEEFFSNVCFYKNLPMKRTQKKLKANKQAKER
jgi:hypothetical protein